MNPIDVAWIVLKNEDTIAHPDWDDVDGGPTEDDYSDPDIRDHPIWGINSMAQGGPIPYPEELKAHHDAHDWDDWGYDDEHHIQHQKYMDTLIHHKVVAGEPIHEFTFGSDGVDTDGTRTGAKWVYGGGGRSHIWHHPDHPEAGKTETDSHPIDTDPFTMQKPQMKDILTQIAEELGRRGGYTEKPSSPPDRNNPFVSNKRKEMLDLQQRIEGEQARRKTKRADKNA